MNAKGWLSGLAFGCAMLIVGTVGVAAADDGGTGKTTHVQVADASPAKEPEPMPVYAARGAESCLRCHDSGAPLAILRTSHAVKGDARTPFAANACETCHGASPEHMGKPPPGTERRFQPAIVFKGDRVSPVEERNKVCLTCHENGARMNWRGSQHSNNDLACNDCHTLHTTDDSVLTKTTQPDVCFKCHKEQRSQAMRISHHPIKEGKVVCSDCHNPHGSVGPKLLKEVTLNQTCYNCHPDKRGPNLFEHEPVREACNTCHVPHGSSQPRLLRERPPYLCLNCHGTRDNSAGHNGSFFGTNFQPGGTQFSTGAAASGMIQMFNRGCVNCHSQIHGSNSPGGQALTR